MFMRTSWGRIRESGVSQFRFRSWRGKDVAQRELTFFQNHRFLTSHEG